MTNFQSRKNDNTGRQISLVFMLEKELGEMKSNQDLSPFSLVIWFIALPSHVVSFKGDDFYIGWGCCGVVSF